MKKMILSFILILFIFLDSVYSHEINSSTSKFTNLNEKVSYVFLKGVSKYSRQYRIMNTIVSGVTSLGFLSGYLLTEDSKIKRLCLVESIAFLIITPVIYLIRSNNEKIISKIDNNHMTPMEGLKEWKNSLLFKRILSSAVLIVGGGYCAYKGIEWAQTGTYIRGNYEFLYLVGFTYIAYGIVNLFVKYPDEHFYDSLKDNKLISQKISTSLYICQNNYYGGINYRF